LDRSSNGSGPLPTYDTPVLRVRGELVAVDLERELAEQRPSARSTTAGA
jgi:hypothetical protein